MGGNPFPVPHASETKREEHLRWTRQQYLVEVIQRVFPLRNVTKRAVPWVGRFTCGRIHATGPQNDSSRKCSSVRPVMYNSASLAAVNEGVGTFPGLEL